VSDFILERKRQNVLSLYQLQGLSAKLPAPTRDVFWNWDRGNPWMQGDVGPLDLDLALDHYTFVVVCCCCFKHIGN